MTAFASARGRATRIVALDYSATALFEDAA